MNIMTIKGNLAKPMELKKSKDGKVVFATGTVAENHNDRVNYFQFTLFGKQAEYAYNSCHTGTAVLISGPFKSTKYEKDGKTTVTWSVAANTFENFEAKDTNKVQGTQGTSQKAQGNAPAANETSDAGITSQDEAEAYMGYDGEVTDEDFPF